MKKGKMLWILGTSIILIMTLISIEIPITKAVGGSPFYPITDEEFTDTNKWWTWAEHITSGDLGVSQLIFGVWHGKARDIHGDDWATVGATQGDRPHAHYNPKPNAKMKTTLLMGEESESTLEIKFRRTIQTPYYTQVLWTFQSQLHQYVLWE